MNLSATHEELLAELDAMLSEAPTEARDIRDELFDLVQQHRGDRATQRPGEREDWGR
jgi:hypothetical protein